MTLPSSPPDPTFRGRSPGNEPNTILPPVTGSGLPIYQTEANAASAHQMFVAILILAAFGMIMILIAGQSKTAGNVVAGFLFIMLLVQGITRVNPFVAWVAKHPLTPTQP